MIVQWLTNPEMPFRDQHMILCKTGEKENHISAWRKNTPHVYVEQLKMLVKNPPKWLFRSNFFVKSAQIFAYSFLFTYLTMRCCFFSSICLSFSRKSKPKYQRVIDWRAMKRNKTQWLFKFVLNLQVRVRWHKWLTRVIAILFFWRTSVHISKF